MSVALIATDCPPVQVFDGFRTLALGPVVNDAYTAGETSTVLTKLNNNGAQSDLLGRYGGGSVYGVAYGLGLTPPGSGLTLTVNAGHALIDGVIELATDTTIVVPDNTARVWIWLRQAGVLFYTTTIIPPGAGTPFVLLGNCTTSGGDITATDYSGVVYLRGGMPWRETNDVGAPADTPPASASFWALTQGGVYVWTGAAYVQLG